MHYLPLRISLPIKFPALTMLIESLNSVLKMRLRLHRGLSKERRELLMESILGAYEPHQRLGDSTIIGVHLTIK